MSSLERMNLFQEPEARVIIADLALPEGSRGLDVGCGVGLYALWLAEAIGPRGRVVGIEPSTERVEAARALVGHGPSPRVSSFGRVMPPSSTRPTRASTGSGAATSYTTSRRRAGRLPSLRASFAPVAGSS